jgi:hypothetical protein
VRILNTAAFKIIENHNGTALVKQGSPATPIPGQKAEQP